MTGSFRFHFVCGHEAAAAEQTEASPLKLTPALCDPRLRFKISFKSVSPLNLFFFKIVLLF